MIDAPAIVWFRRDLRIADNPALHAAARAHRLVVPFFVLDPEFLRARDTASRHVAYLLQCLSSLSANIEHIGGRLFIKHGDPRVEVPKMAAQTKAAAVYWNNDYEPHAIQRDRAIESSLETAGRSTHRFDDQPVHAPGSILKSDGTPYTVFTPYFKTWRARPVRAPLPALRRLQSPPGLRTDPLPSAEELGHAAGIDLPPAGERAARAQLTRFCAGPLHTYRQHRDFPRLDGTSRLSIPLRFGTLSAATLKAAAQRVLDRHPAAAREIECFLSEVAWRDFYKSILWHFPHVAERAFRPVYDQLQWEDDEERFQAWCAGRTGFPIVDAGMRQLNQTGWMHNRLRMITASFLTKDLLIDWRRGERYFMRQLLDGDLAANNGGWQWSAGTGTDAQPWFRIFNPHSQAAKFDREGAFIRGWIPEIDTARYPPPIVDHSRQRAKAMAIYRRTRSHESPRT